MSYCFKAFILGWRFVTVSEYFHQDRRDFWAKARILNNYIIGGNRQRKQFSVYMLNLTVKQDLHIYRSLVLGDEYRALYR